MSLGFRSLLQIFQESRNFKLFLPFFGPNSLLPGTYHGIVIDSRIFFGNVRLMVQNFREEISERLNEIFFSVGAIAMKLGPSA